MSNETKIKELESKIERFESLLNVEVKELKEEVEALKQKEPWPKVDDHYYCYNAAGMIGQPTYDDDNVDHFNKATGNCHRTKEQAIRHKEYITSPRVRARELVEMCEGFDPAGSYSVESAIAVQRDPRELYVATAIAGYYHGGLSFTNKYQAEGAILYHGDICKVALGVIVGEEAERIVREYVGRG